MGKRDMGLVICMKALVENVVCRGLALLGL